MNGRNKKWLARVLVILLCISFIIPVYAATTKDKINDKKNQISQLEKEKKALQTKINNLKKEQADIKTYIAQLDDELANIAEKLYLLGEEKVELEENIEITEANLAQAEITEAEQYAAMKLRIKYMYENSNENFLEALINSKSLEDFLNRAEYIEQVMKKDRGMLDEYAATTARIAAYREQLLDEKTELELLIEITEGALANMEMLIASKEEELLRYNNSIADNQKLQKEIAASEDAMNKELAALEEQLKKEEAARKLVYDGGSFIWPLKNNFRISSPFGYRTHPITKQKNSLHNGIDIPAPLGTNIMAAYKGTVATVAYNSSAGNYIMIDHGSGLYTVYMHCSKIIAKKGQSVKQGETIALVGSTGSSTAPHLHFSVRLNGTYIDPSPYVAGLH